MAGGTTRNHPLARNGPYRQLPGHERPFRIERGDRRKTARVCQALTHSPSRKNNLTPIMRGGEKKLDRESQRKDTSVSSCGGFDDDTHFRPS